MFQEQCRRMKMDGIAAGCGMNNDDPDDPDDRTQNPFPVPSLYCTDAQAVI
jgi:hypothetical protein